jgi:hypothetical protein
VRKDWGSNITVEGAWTFFDPDAILGTPVEKIREQFQRQGIRYACYCGGWVDRKHDIKRIGFGTGVLDGYWADFRGRLKGAAARIHEACPGVKVLVYYDTQRDTAEGGHERFRDSWLTDPNGNQYSTEWSGVYSLTYSVVATLGNSYGKAMLAAADRYLEEMGIDGLYWDEMECVSYGEPLITYNALDGHSCILDPKRYTIRKEIGITTLLGEGRHLRQQAGDLSETFLQRKSHGYVACAGGAEYDAPRPQQCRSFHGFFRIDHRTFQVSFRPRQAEAGGKEIIAGQAGQPGGTDGFQRAFLEGVILQGHDLRQRQFHIIKSQFLEDGDPFITDSLLVFRYHADAISVFHSILPGDTMFSFGPVPRANDRGIALPE